MEQNQFEGLEELEQEPVKQEVSKGLKEYEKLLVAEAERATFAKAKSLVKFGCFEQKQEPVLDFSKYTVIEKNTKYKGYTLYQNIETSDLLFVLALVENNKGDVDEDKNMTPYAYDVLYVESMDEETYQEVCNAAKNNLNSTLKAMYIASFVVFFVLVAISLFYIIYTFISASSTDFFGTLASALYGCGFYIVGSFIMLPLLVLMKIKYSKYTNSNK